MMRTLLRERRKESRRLGQLLLLLGDGVEGGQDLAPAVGPAAGAASQFHQIIGDGGAADGQLVIHVALLELVGDDFPPDEEVVQAGQRQQLVVFAVEDGMVRAVDLVEAEDVEIDVPACYLDRAVRGERHAIDDDAGAAFVDEAGDVGDRVDGAEDVGGVGEADQFGARGHQRVQVGKLQFQRIRADGPKS